MQRSQYLGGSKTQVQISEVLQTSESATTPQANMAGHGIAVTAGKDFTHFCEEHGFIMSLLSVRPRTAYYQGMPKVFRKVTDRFDYAIPSFAHLGEEPIYKEEVFWNFINAANENRDEWGYQQIYADYKENLDRITGQMRSTFDDWHLARKFDFPGPDLNQSFIYDLPSLRCFAVQDTDEDNMLAYIQHYIEAKRKLPYYGTPAGLVR